MKFVLLLSNYVLHLFHLMTVFFTLFGWIFKEIRFAHLLLLIITFISWFGLGRFFGFGYCFITDWQWKIKKKLGERPIRGGYIKYLLDRITGRDFDPQKTATNTMKLVFVIFFISAILNLNDYFNLFQFAKL